jgi:signal peptidase I
MSEEGRKHRPRSAHPITKTYRYFRRIRRNWFVALVLDFVFIIGAALAISLLVKAFVVRSFFIPSESMLETLQVNDRIIVSVALPGVSDFNRGDVVVFRDPGGWLSPQPEQPREPWQQVMDFFLGAFGITAEDSTEHLVKRVVGIEGDIVVCCDSEGLVTVNGEPISEVYVRDGFAGDFKFEVTVPENSFWVMGDNRRNSQDSRFHSDLPSKGFVHRDFVVGRAFLVSWPLDNWNWLESFEAVFANVPEPAN